MKIGIIAPSKLESLEEINPEYKKIISEVVDKILGFEIVLTPDKGSVSEYFAKEYLKANMRRSAYPPLRNSGAKVYSIIPVDDKEFGNDWVNKEIGEIVNCGTWRNQPEKLNEETDLLICLGYSAGGMIEIAYSKWFRKKPIYIIKELISQELPKELEKNLDLNYVGVDEFDLK